MKIQVKKSVETTKWIDLETGYYSVGDSETLKNFFYLAENKMIQVCPFTGSVLTFCESNKGLCGKYLLDLAENGTRVDQRDFEKALNETLLGSLPDLLRLEWIRS